MNQENQTNETSEPIQTILDGIPVEMRGIPQYGMSGDGKQIEGLTKVVLHRYIRDDVDAKVKVIRGAKNYQWEITVDCRDWKRMVEVANEIDGDLRAIFGPEVDEVTEETTDDTSGAKPGEKPSKK